MRARISSKLLIASGFLLLGSALTAPAFGQEYTKREITRTTEKELAASLEVAFGTVTVARGDRSKVVIAEYWRDRDEKQRLEMSYEISNNRGNLDIELTDSRKSRKRDDSSISWEERRSDHSADEDRHLSAKFTDAVPIAFKIALGAGKGDFDFSGLKVKRLKVSVGASSADLRCDELNTIACDEVIIESGVSKFSAEGLCNLNFRKLKFNGGIGAYKLDFSGKLQQSATAEIEVGLGAVTVYVPRDMPVRVMYDESWFSSMDFDDNFVRVKKSLYETENFRGSDKYLTIKIESGLGSVKLRTR
ncbi:MAG: LiaF domain-containing protein [Bacteroidota bacterium]